MTPFDDDRPRVAQLIANSIFGAAVIPVVHGSAVEPLSKPAEVDRLGPPQRGPLHAEAEYKYGARDSAPFPGPPVLSSYFPASVVAYRAGTFDSATVDLLKQRMSAAVKNRLTLQLLTLWKLTAIEPVPLDFDETIVNILKSYPPPVSQHDKQIRASSVSTAKRNQ